MTERDVVDRVMENMINRDRSRRAVIKKMKELGLIHGAKDLARTKTSSSGIRARPPKEWAEHELVELRRLFEEVRGSSDPLGLIVDRMPIRRAKHRIRDKIIELALVSDAKELRKKRPNKKKSSKRADPLADNTNQEEEDENDRILFQERPRVNLSDDDDSSDESSSSSDDDDNSSDEEGERRAAKSRTVNRPYGFMRENMEAFNTEKLTGPLAQMMDGGTYLILFSHGHVSFSSSFFIPPLLLFNFIIFLRLPVVCFCCRS